MKVYNAKFSEENLAGLLSRRGKTVTMLISEADPPYRKRFSIGHEIGHYLLHLEGDGEVIDQVADMFRTVPSEGERERDEWRREVEANQFAAALLMPAELVRAEWERDKSIAGLARRFNVSEEAMGIRIATLGLG